MRLGGRLPAATPLMPAVFADPQAEDEVGEDDHGDHHAADERGVEPEDENRREGGGDQDQVDDPDRRPSTAGFRGTATGTIHYDIVSY